MQLVIDIEEKRFRDIQRISTVQLKGRTPTLEQVIAHGTPLPKGHGKIIDVADLLDRICLDDTDENREDNVGEIITLEDIDFIPAIIEADEAESEDGKCHIV